MLAARNEVRKKSSEADAAANPKMTAAYRRGRRP
jgi:hypothetical protein